MTFEEAHELLNGMDPEAVATEMSHWHPTILGEMLKAVQIAKRERYPGGRRQWRVQELAPHEPARRP